MRAEWLGRVPYADAWARQVARREQVIAGAAPEALWLLEHDPVITLGRRGGEVHQPEPAWPVVQTERGGLATVHEPGQLVGYCFKDVRRCGIRRFVEAVEAGLVGWLAEQGVDAGTRAGFPGVWVGEEKVAAVGFHVRSGVTMHGFALNLVNDLAGFSRITPCGLRGVGVTSLERLRGTAPCPGEAAPMVGRTILDALGTLG